MLKRFSTSLLAVSSSLILCMVPLSASANTTQVGTFTLDNGAQVVLKDDFTWEYVLTKKEPVSSKNKTQTSVIAAPVAGAASAKVATTSSSMTKESLTTQAMANPSLLGQTAKNGIAVSLAKTQWDGNKLGLTFNLASTSSDSMVTVLINADFYNDQGVKLQQQELQVWQAIKRMPETYLRKGETRQSKVVWVEGIDKSQWKKQLMTLKITELDTW
ncbi:DUF3157 family protein [Vibrio algicola]|uniref:DUF3157 family protein n=1 Tax=Vibrio algicola TaxID=2662262 RepID=A0A5Q0THI6_9VIBR|nr:DUF3157 family protein [Vibrio algicola]